MVKAGYDKLGSRYRTYYEQAVPQRYTNWLTAFAQLLSPGTRVLELGCADGIPTARYLSQHVNYLGVDISPVQIEHARVNVPMANFAVADMATLRFPDHSFGGVIALYSIIHLPVAEQPALVNAIYQWLKPEGYFLCILGADKWTGTEADWIEPGTLMYWSHTDAATYTYWFKEAGFTVIDSHFVDEGNGGHTFFLLKK
ncbi:class I SAM-dependent methyltransferase [Spirosoma pollinicola]|uniref:Class I SAM-dependent methyltransferase n=1 Tax=Spirosoma pollinicola TaxID=2057025 RepID=A0A2K8ZB86_9BACT|nr:class I SAM-dependent methyltransferase [Spirosoma pollinicola]